jgi:hypothetical protein
MFHDKRTGLTMSFPENWSTSDTHLGKKESEFGDILVAAHPTSEELWPMTYVMVSSLNDETANIIPHESLDDLVESQLDYLNNNMKRAMHIDNITSESIKVGNIPAHRVVYAYNREDAFAKFMRIWFITKQPFEITYKAFNPQVFEKYLNDVENMIRSVKVSE